MTFANDTAVNLLLVQGGQQEDAEEFFGFFLDTLEEEMLAISKSLTDGSQARSSGQERNSTEGDDWLEVGKKNKAVVTRSVCDKMIYSILRLFVFMCFMT